MVPNRTNETCAILVVPSAFEYWCAGCGQLRLWARPEPFEGCGNCGAFAIVPGAPGELAEHRFRRPRLRVSLRDSSPVFRGRKLKSKRGSRR